MNDERDARLARLKQLRAAQELSRQLDAHAAVVLGTAPARHAHDAAHAAIELGQHLRDQDVPAIQACLRHRDLRVREEVQLGLHAATTWTRGSPGAWAALTLLLRGLLLNADESATGTTAQLLLRADREAAVAFLTDESGVFDARHPRAWAACVALCQQGVRVPCDKLNRMHDEVMKQPYADGDPLPPLVLELIGWAACPDASAVISAAAASPHAQLRRAATHARYVLTHRRRPPDRPGMLRRALK